MLLEMSNLKFKFIDCYNFVRTLLNRFPKIFNLTKLEKIYFVFLSCPPDNVSYEKTIPIITE